MVATIGAIIVYFHAPYGPTNYEVPYLGADWKKFFGILLESLSAVRTGYSGDVCGANLNRAHYPENTERFGANDTTGDKLIGHEAFPHRLPLTLEVERQQPRKRSLVRYSGFPPCLKESEEVGGNGQPWL